LIEKIFLTLILLFAHQGLAGEFNYFDSEINYWEKDSKKENDVPEGKTEKKQEVVSKKEKTSKSEENKFDWKTYMNPENKEFFKEGDHTPPEPFMELARNPSDENISNWFSYIELKNRLASRLQERMTAYMSKNKIKIGDPGVQAVNESINDLPTTHPHAKQFRLRMYFDSKCPHCKRMFGTLKELQEMGFYVEALQVDNDPVSVGYELPITKASQDDMKKFANERVPLVLIADMAKKALLPPVRGYRSTKEVLSVIELAIKN